LPHYDKPGLVQAVTFRLADSLPKEKRSEWEHLLHVTDDGERIRQIEDYLDRGAGSCVLRQPACAEIVQNALLTLRWRALPAHRVVRDAESRPRPV
jgi:putative transposase